MPGLHRSARLLHLMGALILVVTSSVVYMGRVLAPSVVHSGFEHRSVQIRDYEISINCFQGRNQRRSLGTCTPSLKSVFVGGGERGQDKGFVKM
jgi:hypothetical protein